MNVPHASLALLLLALSSGAAAARADVLVVDDDSGPGVDFTSLDAAVAAAAEGDTLLVRDGTYAPFAVFGKSLDVVAENAGGVVVQAPAPTDVAAAVLSLGPGQSVTLRGITVAPYIGTNPVSVAVAIGNSQGEVWLEDCDVSGGVFPVFSVLFGFPAVRVTNARLTAVRCTFRGGGVSPPLSGVTGANALDVGFGEVRLYGCTLEGGAEGPGFSCGGTVKTAGHGARVFDGAFLFASGCTFRGGEGGAGVGEDGANGGAGLFVPAGEQPDVWLLDCTLAAGTGGAGSGCLDGVDGLPIDAPAGVVSGFPGRGYPFSASSPVRVGQATVLSFEADPGDMLFLGLALAPQALFVPALSGVAHYDPFLPGTLLGVAPATGTLDVPLVVAPLSPGVESVGLHLQSVVLTTDWKARLGTPSALLLLDAAF